MLSLWHSVVGLGKAVLLVLFICRRTCLPFITVLHSLPSGADPADVLDVYSFTGALGIVVLCTSIECLFLALELDFS